jgi:thiamine phosphate synthase YjbQ (UPF0047 family)
MAAVSSVAASSIDMATWQRLFLCDSDEIIIKRVILVNELQLDD